MKLAPGVLHPVSCMLLFSELCASMSPRGDSYSTLIGEESQVRGRSKAEYSHAKLTPGGEELAKNRGMRG